MAKERNKGGRPPNPMPEPIPDTPENVARAIMQGPPKDRWRFEEGETTSITARWDDDGRYRPVRTPVPSDDDRG